MSDGTGVKKKEGHVRQTRMGDFFSKSSDKSKNKAGQSASEKQSTSKKGLQTVNKKAPLDVKKVSSNSKKGDNKKVTAEIKKLTEPVVGRRNLKRKVSGAGMFHSAWTRGAQNDTEEYRNGYPGKSEHPNWTDNLDFYMCEIPSKPDGDYIDNIHADWWGDYDKLEIHHGYIQWLFPIRESGLNWHAQELQLHEIDKLRKDKKARKRVLMSYKMMLDFYGMKLDDEETGRIKRAENWRERFFHLNRSFHNYLRITRILKCLGEFGYEHLKANFVRFVLHEGMVEGTLGNLIDSCLKYWIGVLRDDKERNGVFDLYEELVEKQEKEDKKIFSKSLKIGGSNGKASMGRKTNKAFTMAYKTPQNSSYRQYNGDFSDEDDAVEYAMNLIDSDPEDTCGNRNKKSEKKDASDVTQGSKKAGKDHEMSDSDGGDDDFKTPDAMEDSQEMNYWNAKSGNKGEKSQVESSHHSLGSDAIDDDEDDKTGADGKGLRKDGESEHAKEDFCENPLPEACEDKGRKVDNTANEMQIKSGKEKESSKSQENTSESPAKGSSMKTDGTTDTANDSENTFSGEQKNNKATEAEQTGIQESGQETNNSGAKAETMETD